MSEDILKKITLEINKHESLEDKELNNMQNLND